MRGQIRKSVSQQIVETVKDVSGALFLHKNTLQYQLDRIWRETGYNPRSFQDAVILHLGLKLLLEVGRRERGGVCPVGRQDRRSDLADSWSVHPHKICYNGGNASYFLPAWEGSP